MARVAELPDGLQLEFPDDTTDEEMTLEVNKFAAREQHAQRLGAMLEQPEPTVRERGWSSFELAPEVSFGLPVPIPAPLARAGRQAIGGGVRAAASLADMLRSSVEEAGIRGQTTGLTGQVEQTLRQMAPEAAAAPAVDPERTPPPAALRAVQDAARALVEGTTRREAVEHPVESLSQLFTDPEHTILSGIENLGPTLAMMLPSIGVAALSGPLAPFTGGAAGTVIESLTEAGDTLEQAREEGKSEKEAREAAKRVMQGNMSLLGASNALELAAALAPLPAWAQKVVARLPGAVLRKVGVGGLRAAAAGLTEGQQELYQQRIQEAARSGGKVDLALEAKTPEERQARALGQLYGGVFGGASEVANLPAKLQRERLADLRRIDRVLGDLERSVSTEGAPAPAVATSDHRVEQVPAPTRTSVTPAPTAPAPAVAITPPAGVPAGPAGIPEAAAPTAAAPPTAGEATAPPSRPAPGRSLWAAAPNWLPITPGRKAGPREQWAFGQLTDEQAVDQAKLPDGMTREEALGELAEARRRVEEYYAGGEQIERAPPAPALEDAQQTVREALAKEGERRIGELEAAGNTVAAATLRAELDQVEVLEPSEGWQQALSGFVASRRAQLVFFRGGPKAYTGVTRGNVIGVRVDDAQSPWVGAGAVALHELVHRIEDVAPGIYQSLQQWVEQQSPELWATTRDEVAKSYQATRGRALTAQELPGETLARVVEDHADVVWRAIGDRSTMAKMRRYRAPEKQLVRQIHDALAAVVKATRLPIGPRATVQEKLELAQVAPLALRIADAFQAASGSRGPARGTRARARAATQPAGQPRHALAHWGLEHYQSLPVNPAVRQVEAGDGILDLFYEQDGKQVGHLTIERDRLGGFRTHSVGSLVGRRGVATALYEQAARITGGPRRGTVGWLSEEGQEFLLGLWVRRPDLVDSAGLRRDIEDARRLEHEAASRYGERGVGGAEAPGRDAGPVLGPPAVGGVQGDLGRPGGERDLDAGAPQPPPATPQPAGSAQGGRGAPTAVRGEPQPRVTPPQTEPPAGAGGGGPRLSPTEAPLPARGVNTASPARPTNVMPDDSPFKARFALERVEREVQINGRVRAVKIYTVSVVPGVLAQRPDGAAAITIRDPNHARELNAHPERVRDWATIYDQAKKITTAKGAKKFSDAGKVRNIPIVALTKGCQRALVAVERVESGLLPAETRVEACYGGDCWVNLQFNRVYGNFENMEVRDLQLADEAVIDNLMSPANRRWLEQGLFVRMGQQGDDSHILATNLAERWLDGARTAKLKPKTVFISAGYAPVSAERYRALAPYGELFELHISLSGWFHPNEIMLRLGEFVAAREAGLPVVIRLVTNRDGLQGVTMPNEELLLAEMERLHADQREVLETPYHYDVTHERSRASGLWKFICCETGYCDTCGARCMVKVRGPGSVATSWERKPESVGEELPQIESPPAPTKGKGRGKKGDRFALAAPPGRSRVDQLRARDLARAIARKEKAGQPVPGRWRRLAGEFELGGQREGKDRFALAPPVNSPAFQAWFRGSRVVDAEGRPLVVYHGTDWPEPFSVFDPARGDLGAHFATEPAVANFFSDYGVPPSEGPARVYPVYLSIKNPLRLRDFGGWDYSSVLQQAQSLGVITLEEFDEWRWRHTPKGKSDPAARAAAVRALLESKGYDGVVYLNRHETFVGKDTIIPTERHLRVVQWGAASDYLFKEHVPEATDAYIAFRSEQVKSATGNTGAFDPANPDIRFALATNRPHAVLEIAGPAGVGGDMSLGGVFGDLEAATWPALVAKAQAAAGPAGLRVLEHDRPDALGRRGLSVYNGPEADEDFDDFLGTIWAGAPRATRAAEEGERPRPYSAAQPPGERFALARPGTFNPAEPLTKPETYNPIVGVAAQPSAARMAERAAVLEAEIDARYESGNLDGIEDLEAEYADLVEREEGGDRERETEVDGVSVEEQLAQLYDRYLKDAQKGGWGSAALDKDTLTTARDIIRVDEGSGFSPRMMRAEGRPARRVTDAQLWRAMRDAWDEWHLRRDRLRAGAGRGVRQLEEFRQRFPARFAIAPPVESKAFRRWFGDSKVVDAEGRPLVVYHGTTADVDFSEFWTDGPQDEGEAPGDRLPRATESDPTTYLGAHFTLEARVAGKFAEGLYNVTGSRRGGRIYPVYLRVAKPLRLTESALKSRIFRQDLSSEAAIEYELDRRDAKSDDDIFGLYTTDAEFREEINRAVIGDVESDEVGEVAHEAAWRFRQHLISQGYDGIFYENEIEGGEAIVVFEPSQVKSATGNVGTYDQENPDIRFAVRAYHGTPTSRLEGGRFSTDYIGSGEGTSEEGWGLYFSSERDVAQWYRDTLVDDEHGAFNAYRVRGKRVPELYGLQDWTDTKPIPDEYWDIENEAKWYLRAITQGRSTAESRGAVERSLVAAETALGSWARWTPGVNNFISWVRNELLTATPGEVEFIVGATYEVELAPNREEFLDLNESLSEQGPVVQRLRGALEPGATTNEQQRAAARVVRVAIDGDVPGATLYWQLAEVLGGAQRASLYLRSLGIPGNRYIGDTSGVENFVVFDDRQVEVKARYALARGDQAPEFQLNPERRADAVRRVMLDSMLRAERVQGQIEEVTGETIGDALDVYRVQENYAGRVTERHVNEVRRPFLDPLKRLMRKLGVKLDDLDRFLYARHAPERNDYLYYLHVVVRRQAARAAIAKEKETRETVGEENPKRVQDLYKELNTIGGRNPVNKLLQALERGFDAARNPLVRLAGELDVEFDPELSSTSEDEEEAGRARKQQSELRSAWKEMTGDRQAAALDRWLDEAAVRDAFREVKAIPHSGMTDRQAEAVMADLVKQGLVDRRQEDTTRHMSGDEAIEALGQIDYSMPPEDVQRAMAEVRAAWRQGLEAHLGGRRMTAVYNGKLAELAAVIDRATQRKLRTLLEAGLETEETIEKLQGVYSYYVPLKGAHLKGDLDELFGARGRSVGQGFDIRGDEIKHGLGRYEVAANPVTAQVFLDLETAIVRDEKNKVGRALKRMIEQFPNAVGVTGEKLWEINPVRERWRINDEGEVQSVLDLTANESEWVLSVKEGGQEYYLHIYDAMLARAVKNTGAVQLNTLTKLHGKLQRQLASWLTSRNPAFIPVNFLRDLGTAGIHLTASRGWAFAKSVMGDVNHALPAILRAEKAMSAVSEDSEAPLQPEDIEAAVSGEWEEWWRRFRRAGAMTGWSNVESIQERATTLEREIRDMGPGGWKATRRAVRSTLDLVEGINMGVENAIRLSAFRHAIEDLGMSELKAASYARNLTVNFNRKGEAGSWLASWFMFANASLQGMDAVAKHFYRHPKVMAKFMGGLFLAGYLLALFNRWAGGDDEEDERDRWERVTAGTKERNAVVMFPGGWKVGGIKLPLPIAYNLPFFMGSVFEQLTHDMVVGKRVRASMAASHLTGAVVNAFNPLSGDWLTSPLPTALDAPMQIMANRNTWGGPIYPTAYPGDIRPDSQRYFPGASWTSKMLTRGLNRVSGGDEFEAGLLDFSPESVDHLVNAWGGAIVQIGKQVVDLGGVLGGEPFSVRNLPIASRFLAETTDSTVTEEYREAQNDLDRIRARATAYRKRGDAKALRELRQNHGPMLSPALQARLNALEKRIREARKQNERELATKLQKQYLKIYDRAAAGR